MRSPSFCVRMNYCNFDKLSLHVLLANVTKFLVPFVCHLKTHCIVFSSVKFLARLAISLFGGKSSMNHSFMISVSRIKNIINLNRLTFELPCANFTALLLVCLKNWMLHTIHDFGCVNILWEKYHTQRHQLGNDRKNHETIYFWYENKLHFKRNMEKINWHHFACMVENVFHLKLKREDNFLAMEFFYLYPTFSDITSFISTFIWSIFFLFIFSKYVHVFNEWIQLILCVHLIKCSTFTNSTRKKWSIVCIC